VDVFGGIITAALLLPLGNWLYWKLERKAGPDPLIEGQKATE